MKEEFHTCMKDDDSTNHIEYYSCFYNQCNFCRYLCQFCKLDVNHQHKTHIANKDDYVYQQQLLKQSIRNAKVEIFEYGNQQEDIVGAISNDLKYVAIGGRDLHIWDHQNNNLIQTIPFNTRVLYIKFTNDSKILYVITLNLTLYKFNVQKLFNYANNYGIIRNIYNISNEILLTSTTDGKIIKLNIYQNKQFLKIKAHSSKIPGLDFNKSLNIIVSGSSDKSIALWNANDGQLLIRKQLTHSGIIEVLFVINKIQLISLDSSNKLIIWNIDYQAKQLQQQTMLYIFDNIQLVLHQQFTITTGALTFRIYSIEGELIRKFDHNLCKTYGQKLIQRDCLHSCLIFAKSDYENKQLVFKIKLD